MGPAGPETGSAAFRSIPLASRPSLTPRYCAAIRLLGPGGATSPRARPRFNFCSGSTIACAIAQILVLKSEIFRSRGLAGSLELTRC